MEKGIVLSLLLLLIFMACEHDPLEDHSQEVAIQVQNQLTTSIDSFQFHFDSSQGEDSILITMLDEDQLSAAVYFDDLRYYYREESDLFFIKKGYFVIASNTYYIANCFCEPDLLDSTLSEGKVTLEVYGIDSIRGNVTYSISRE